MDLRPGQPWFCIYCIVKRLGIACLLAGVLSACSSPKPASQAAPVRITQPETRQQFHERFAPRELTPEEKAEVSKLSAAYYSGVASSIASIDDKVSPASSIARAAIAENIERLRAWKRAATAPVAQRLRELGSNTEEAIMRLPGQGHVDEATLMVLKIRRNSAQ